MAQPSRYNRPLLVKENQRKYDLGKTGHGINLKTIDAVRQRAIDNGYTRNKRSVWTIATQPFKEAHFAIFPPKLVEPMVLAGCPEKGIVLDPFMGAGTTALVARKLNRNYLGVELNPQYIEIAEKRIKEEIGELFS